MAQKSTSPARSAFSLRPLSEAMHPRPAEWIVRGLFEKGDLVVIFGPPGGGKTAVVADILACIATGTCFHGLSATAGPVCLIAGEGLSGLGKRFKAWEVDRDQPIKPTDFFISNRATQLLHEQAFKELLESLIKLPTKPACIVLDTLSRNFGPGDENFTADMQKVVERVDTLIEVTGAAVILVHHTGLQTKDRARGSSVLNGAADFEYSIHRDGGGLISITCTKSKDHEPPDPLAFEIRQVELPDEWCDGDEPATSIVLDLSDKKPKPKGVKLSPAQNIAFDALREVLKESGRLPPKEVMKHNRISMGHKVVDLNVWRDMAIRRGITDSTDKNSIRRIFTRLVQDLIRKEKIAVFDSWVWLVFNEKNAGQDKTND